MQNPFNANSLRRNNNVSRIAQNYGIVPDAVYFQNYAAAAPYHASQYDSFSRQFQNELELKHHFNSLLNIFPCDDGHNERKELNTNWEFETTPHGGSSVQWYSSRGADHDRWSTTTQQQQQQQHNTLPQQQQQQRHINDGSWVTFNNV